MTYTESKLNNPYHGDFVFAVTQGSINAVMMDYISTPPFPEVTCVWVMSRDAHPQPVQIDFKELLKLADNSDPFKVPDGVDPTKNQDLKNLAKARFLGGFRARMGLPAGLPDDANMVTLGADVTSVKFDLMCSEFDVVQYTPGGDYTSPSWMHKSQPANQPWIFESRVNLQLVKFEGHTSTLPRAVQDRIAALGLQEGAFSIQQLLFILDNPGNSTPPEIIGVTNPSLLYTWLEEYFVGAYWATMKANKQPVLAHGITTQPDPSSLALADLKFQISPYINGATPSKTQQDLYTLCYVGATNIHKLPAALPPFTWNWITEGEQKDWHGAVAVNWSSFAEWLQSALVPYVQSQSLQFHPTAKYKNTIIYVDCSATPGGGPSSGELTPDKVSLSYYTHVDAQDTSVEIKVTEDFKLDVVRHSETQILITQKTVVYLYFYIRGLWTDGNIVDTEMSSVYDMSVDAHGALTFVFNEKESKSTDNSANLDFSGFVNWLEDHPNEKVVDPIKNSLHRLLDMLGHPNLSTASFIVPGHASVAYSGAKFSKSGDLVFHLLYGG